MKKIIFLTTLLAFISAGVFSQTKHPVKHKHHKGKKYHKHPRKGATVYLPPRPPKPPLPPKPLLPPPPPRP